MLFFFALGVPVGAALMWLMWLIDERYGPWRILIWDGQQWTIRDKNGKDHAAFKENRSPVGQ